MEAVQHQDLLGILISAGINRVSGNYFLVERGVISPKGVIQMLNGELTYINCIDIDINNIINVIITKQKQEYKETLKKYIENRYSCCSPYEVLCVLKRANIVDWDTISSRLKKHYIQLIEKLEGIDYEGIREAKTKDEKMSEMGFHLNSEVGRRGFRIDELRSQVVARKVIWSEYRDVIPSGKSIFYANNSKLAAITSEKIRNYIEEYVDGVSSLFAIADKTGDDVLEMLPVYARWVRDGYISLISDEQTRQQGNVSMAVVLIVDDSAVIQGKLRRYLCEEYEVISVTSAMQAIGVLNEREIDLILTDVEMPDIDGNSFCQMIRKIDKVKEVPVIMLTGKDGIIDRVRGKMAGATRYLTKPISKEELLKVIKEYV